MRCGRDVFDQSAFLALGRIRMANSCRLCILKRSLSLYMYIYIITQEKKHYIYICIHIKSYRIKETHLTRTMFKGIMFPVYLDIKHNMCCKYTCRTRQGCIDQICSSASRASATRAWGWSTTLGYGIYDSVP